MQFGVTFKTHVLSDPRIILIGSAEHHALHPLFEDVEDDTFDKIENDTARAFHMIANMMECTDMQSILEVFAQKVLQNLIYSEGSTEEGKQVIEFTLETFDVLVSSPSSCRLLCQSSFIKELIQNHVMQFNILQNDSNLKHIGQFFKILTMLWVHEDFVEDFDQYLAKLNGIIEHIISNGFGSKSDTVVPQMKHEFMKLFYILRGIVSGMTTNRNFGLFFDWFYPEFFVIVGQALTAFINDDELVLNIYKFLAELVNNRCSRLRFDSWNINGLIVFRETAKVTIQYLEWT